MFFLFSLVSALFWGAFLASKIVFMGLIAIFIVQVISIFVCLVSVLICICPRYWDLTRPGPRPGEL